jgi:hypothetical protein
MTSELIACAECANFVQNENVSKMALGRCMSKPHDGHVGQWPLKRHKCRSYRSLSEANLTQNSKGPEGEVSWVCRSCRSDVAFTHDEFMRHVLEEHGFDVRGMKGRKTMLSHMDGRGQSVNIYSWEIGGIEAVQTVCVPRMRGR